MNITNNPNENPDPYPYNEEPNDYKLIISKGKLLIKNIGEEFLIPHINELQPLLNENGSSEYVGNYKGIKCFCVQQDNLPSLPSVYELIDIKSIPTRTGNEELYLLAGTATHLLHWSRLNQYCGCCGHKTINKTDERAKLCPSCGNVVYTRISPAVITAIFRGDEILLAHNRNFQGNMHSLIAGFVEPGETLEDCVEREIREEIGITVKNIRYFCSQPWPFPDSLMIAFLADYESGEISVDGEEITKAAWYTADSLPEIPSALSVAGKIIRWYQEQHA